MCWIAVEYEHCTCRAYCIQGLARVMRGSLVPLPLWEYKAPHNIYTTSYISF